jgi:2-polyprenyl-3-methyl-5-hydroxy-6-metoxy-1,4-benzoquinol methylase
MWRRSTSPSGKLASSRGFTVYCNEITDSSFFTLESSFDIVTATEVLEHLYEPKRYLKVIYKLLKPGGTLFYTTGNAERLEIEGENWSYLHPEGHLYYFTPGVLRKYFTEIGFEILDPYEYPTFYVERSSSPYQLLRNSAKWILLHSRFSRLYVLRPYLKAQHANLLPMARKPITTSQVKS